MFERILVPLDGSALSEGALPPAEALARALESRLVLVRSAMTYPLRATYPTEPARDAVREAEEYLRALASALAERGLEAETATPYAQPAEGILQEARDRDAALIVMATHGRGGLGRWVFGSVAEGVLAAATAPVLLVRSWRAEPTSIGTAETPLLAVPLDGSELARGALPVAERLAEALGGTLLLVRSVYPVNPPLTQEWMVSSYVAEELRASKEDAEAYLLRESEELAARGRTVRTHVGVGAPQEVIARTTREQEAALVVMATHGRTGAREALLGSVANATLREADVPVMLVRPRGMRDE